MDILYIVIPAYNESETIESVINDWYPVVEKHNGVRSSGVERFHSTSFR